MQDNFIYVNFKNTESNTKCYFRKDMYVESLNEAVEGDTCFKVEFRSVKRKGVQDGGFHCIYDLKRKYNNVLIGGVGNTVIPLEESASLKYYTILKKQKLF